MEVKIELLSLIELICESYNERINVINKYFGKNGVDENKFGYIPTNPEKISEIFKTIDFNGKSFIDAGCGVPIIPKIAEYLGATYSKGLEIDRIHLQMDKYSREHYLIEGDISTFNFKQYDIIYSYVPIIDTELMIKALENMMKTMKKEAILIFNSAGRLEPEKLPKNFDVITSQVYKYTKI